MAFNFFRRKKKSSKQTKEKAATRPDQEVEETALPPDEIPPDEIPDDISNPAQKEDPVSDPAEAEDAHTIPEDSDSTDAEKEETGAPAASGGFYQRLRQGLSRTRRILTTDIDDLFRQGKPVDQETLDDLEERLITSDIGVQAATEIIETIAGARVADTEDLKSHLKKTILSYMTVESDPSPVIQGKPHIIMVVGVNGVGKTTTIGKLAAAHVRSGKSVLLVAADTFRAAAIEQLEVWAQRVKVDIVKHRPNSDPAAVVFDGIEAARARNIDIVLIDTAGRLHTKANLMEELKKIKRTIAGKIPEAPHEVLLVLDATTGQNALSQARTFAGDTGVTGLVLTKLDGTAKGGIAINLCHTFQIPLQYIGVGEQIDDLQPFHPEKFIEALL